MAKNETIGRPFARVDGRRKACGDAVYGPDIKMPDMLHAKFLASPYPHARIVHVDTEKAEKLSGVNAILTPKIYYKGTKKQRHKENLCLFVPLSLCNKFTSLAV